MSQKINSVNFPRRINGVLRPSRVNGVYLFHSPGDTWSYNPATGLLTNTPGTIGSELLSDPGLEAAYTAGKCATLAKSGSPTLAQSADVHGGSKAQQFTATLNDDQLYRGYSATGSKWYRYGVYGKRTAGTAGTTYMQMTGWQVNARTFHVFAAYTELVQTGLVLDSGIVYPLCLRQYGGAPFDTVIVDDESFKQINLPDMFLTKLFASKNGTFSVPIANTTSLNGVQGGVIARANSQTNPTDYFFAYRGGDGKIYAIKSVGGTVTNIITPTTAAYHQGYKVSLVLTDTEVKVYYDTGDLSAQIGSTYTIVAGDPTGFCHGFGATSNGVQLDYNNSVFSPS